MQMNNDVSVGSQKALSQGRAPMGISSLYVLKALCAFFVVACHTPNAAMSVFFRDLGVPCFFMITGYFLYSHDVSKVISRSSKAARKSLLMLCVLTPIYYLIDPVDLAQTTPALVVRWLFVGIPNKYGGPLWYLVALFWGVTLFRLYLILFKGKGVQWLISLTVVGLFLGRYRFLFQEEESSYFVLNFLNYALPCLSIGYLLRRYEELLLSRCRFIDIAVLLSVILSLEVYALQVYSNGLSSMGPMILTYPTAFAWLCVALQYKNFGAMSFVESIGRDYSASIYYCHMIFVWLFSIVERSVGVDLGYQAFGLFYVSIASLLLAIGWRFLFGDYQILRKKLRPRANKISR